MQDADDQGKGFQPTVDCIVQRVAHNFSPMKLFAASYLLLQVRFLYEKI